MRRSVNRLARAALAMAVAMAALVSIPRPASAGVLLPGYFKGVPSPGPGSNVDDWWDHIARQAKALRDAGFTAVWLPSPLKANGGTFSDGFDVFDDYDLGSKDQKGTTRTRFGTREQLERCVAILRANGIDVYIEL